jgi:UDP-N-acetylmuramoyl-tripeptide--D-alanyl-D-alanine ligase
MRAALATLADLAVGGARKVAVLGEMKELGPLAEEEHAALGDAIAAAGVDLVIGTGGLVTVALERAERQGVWTVRSSSVEEAARVAASLVRPGDVILVKASRSVKAEQVVEALTGKGGASESLPISPNSASSGQGSA